MTYYDRTAGTNGDGSPLHATVEDRYRQAEIADLLARVWQCEIRLWGPLCPIDYYALVDGRLSAVIEFKGRSHPHDRHSTVYLNVRKWLALRMAQEGLGVPALYVVGFSDGVYWIPVNAVDARSFTLGGTVGRVKSHTDVEPVILVPVRQMRRLQGAA